MDSCDDEADEDEELPAVVVMSPFMLLDIIVPVDDDFAYSCKEVMFRNFAVCFV